MPFFPNCFKNTYSSFVYETTMKILTFLIVEYNVIEMFTKELLKDG